MSSQRRRLVIVLIVFGFLLVVVALYVIPGAGAHPKKVADYLMRPPAGAAATCEVGPVDRRAAAGLMGGDSAEFGSAARTCWTQGGAAVEVTLVRYASEQAAVEAIDVALIPAPGESTAVVDGVTRGTTYAGGGTTRSYGRHGDTVIVVTTTSSGTAGVDLAASILRAQDDRL